MGWNLRWNPRRLRLNPHTRESDAFARHSISSAGMRSDHQPKQLWCIQPPAWRVSLATAKQRTAARKNIKNAAAAAKKKRTIAHLPKSTRTALGKQASKVAKHKAH